MPTHKTWCKIHFARNGISKSDSWRSPEKRWITTSTSNSTTFMKRKQESKFWIKTMIRVVKLIKMKTWIKTASDKANSNHRFDSKLWFLLSLHGGCGSTLISFVTTLVYRSVGDPRRLREPNSSPTIFLSESPGVDRFFLQIWMILGPVVLLVGKHNHFFVLTQQKGTASSKPRCGTLSQNGYGTL